MMHACAQANHTTLLLSFEPLRESRRKTHTFSHTFFWQFLNIFLLWGNSQLFSNSMMKKSEFFVLAVSLCLPFSFFFSIFIHCTPISVRLSDTAGFPLVKEQFRVNLHDLVGRFFVCSFFCAAHNILICLQYYCVNNIILHLKSLPSRMN